jgi:hypothetical protein
MRKFSLLLMTVLLASTAIAQNENENEYEQRVYVVRAIAIEPQEDRKVLVAECEAAMVAAGITGIDVTGPRALIGRLSLHRLINQDKYGRVSEDKSQEKKRGEMLICNDVDSFFVSQGRNFIPSFNVVSIDGLTFVAEGGGISDGFGQLPGGSQVMAPQTDPVFYPAEGVLLVNGSATILPSLPFDLAVSLGIPEAAAVFGGTLTSSVILDNADPNGEDDQFETSEGYWVIRLLISIQN